MKTASMLLAILFYILAVVIIVGLIARALKKTKTITAVVADKHETEFDSISHHNPDGSEHVYVLTLACEDGEELKLKASSWIYGTVEKGDRISVTYKGSVITEIHGDFENDADLAEGSDDARASDADALDGAVLDAAASDADSASASASGDEAASEDASRDDNEYDATGDGLK